jgi:myo-inositol 2-dehydrogenase / D-chiro-inositol 1-dehydrogenase
MKNTRRTFLKTALTAGAFTIVPRRVLGGQGFTAPSDQITKAVVGVGGMGHWHLGDTGDRLIAVCDVDRTHIESALRVGGKDVRAYDDYRELLENKDVDVVHIATPPHWHGLIAIAAARAGKDVWCEKPMTRTIMEGEKLVEAVRDNGRVLRVNTWFRYSGDRFYECGITVNDCRKVVESGMLGGPLRVTICGATGFEWKFYWCGKKDLTAEWIPKELNYDFWLGPAPHKPYHPHRVHGTFRGYWDYDGGGVGDMGQHYIDPVQYFLGKDNESPVEVIPDADEQHPDAAGSFRKITLRYADGTEIVLDGVNTTGDVPYIEGPKGAVYKNFRTNVPGLREAVSSMPDPEPPIKDFMVSVRTRQKFPLNEVNGHRSATLVNLAKIAWQLGRRIVIDPATQRCVNDEAANRLIDPPMRAPWSLI